MSTESGNRGSLTVEVVALVPMMMVLVMLAVFGLRWTAATSDAVHAANIAARVASESRAATGSSNGRAAGAASLASSRWCRPANVKVVRIESGDGIRYVSSVTCAIDLAGLSLLRLGRMRASASSSQTVDRFRSDR